MKLRLLHTLAPMICFRQLKSVEDAVSSIFAMEWNGRGRSPWEDVSVLFCRKVKVDDKSSGSDSRCGVDSSHDRAVEEAR